MDGWRDGTDYGAGVKGDRRRGMGAPQGIHKDVMFGEVGGGGGKMKVLTRRHPGLVPRN